MNCARYREALSSHAAGSPASDALQAHLAGCTQCRADLMALQQMLGLAEETLALAAKAEPRGGFASRIGAAVEASAAAQAWRPLWLRPALAGAAAVVLAIALFGIARLTGRSPVVAQAPSPPAAVVESAPQPTFESVPARAADSTRTAASTNPMPPSARRPIARRKPAEPEVLVPPDEARALVQWVAQVNREQRVPALVAADRSAGQAATNIEIQPIEFVPLDVATNTGT